MFDTKLGKPYWEKRHRRKLILEAKNYLNTLPGPEWIYLEEYAVDTKQIRMEWSQDGWSLSTR